MLYITGYNGNLEGRVASALQERYDALSVVELNDEFNNQGFDDKINLLIEALRTELSLEKPVVLANSQGAYLLLHALSFFQVKKEYKLILLSPVLGMTLSARGGRVPVKNKMFREAIDNKLLNLPIKTVVIVGENDILFSEENLTRLLNSYPQIETHFLECGHDIPVNSIFEVLE